MNADLKHLKQPAEAAFRDRLESKVHDWIKPWDGVEQPQAGLVGLPLSKTSISHSGASTTPAAIRTAFKSFTTYSMEYGVDLQELVVRDFGDVQMHVTDLYECHRRIADSLRALYREQPTMIPILVGGDHSTTFPSLQAFVDRHPGQKVGILHFDAHHDMRNLEDGGPSNGTPFRSILEAGLVEGRHLVQIGIRGFMNSRPYHAYALEKGVHIFTSRDVRQMGIQTVLDQAIERASEGTDALYVSFDVDVIDQAYAPGCPAIGTGGMNPWDALDALYRLGTLPQVQALDFVCIDPTVDVRNVTSRLAVQFMLTFLAGVAQRTGRKQGC